jgi:hypothetical protein
MSALTPRDVLADLLGSGDFPVEIADPEAAAAIIVQRLIDAGFIIKGQEDPAMARRDEIEDLKAEIDRLQEAERRALSLADERAKEANELRAQLAERSRS